MSEPTQAAVYSAGSGGLNAEMALAASVKSPSLRGWIVTFLLVGIVLLRGAAIFADVLELSVIDRFEAGTASPGDLEDSNALQQFVAWPTIVVQVLTGIAFMAWLRRAYGNLPALSVRKPSFTPGWSIGAWFVPFLNLVRPFQIVNETWWVSAVPAAADRAEPSFSPPPPAKLRWWWGLWLISLVMGRLDLAVLKQAQTMDAFRFAAYISIVGQLIDAAAALLAIQIVLEISKFQDRRRINNLPMSGTGP